MSAIIVFNRVLFLSFHILTFPVQYISHADGGLFLLASDCITLRLYNFLVIEAEASGEQKLTEFPFIPIMQPVF
jgi:hypothetical protein